MLFVGSDLFTQSLCGLWHRLLVQDGAQSSVSTVLLRHVACCTIFAGEVLDELVWSSVISFTPSLRLNAFTYH